jgi:hypothetical protein
MSSLIVPHTVAFTRYERVCDQRDAAIGALRVLLNTVADSRWHISMQQMAVITGARAALAAVDKEQS